MTGQVREASDGEFDRLLAWAYRGELSGEAMFAALADLSGNADHAASLRVLAELERATAAAIAPLLRRYAVEGGDDERSRRRPSARLNYAASPRARSNRSER